jgi:hypothetical protein
MTKVSTRPQKTATPVTSAVTSVTAPATIKAPVAGDTPSTIVLLVCRDDGLLNDHILTAQSAGFAWHRGQLAFLSDDTREPITLMRLHDWAAAVGELQTIEFHIDPEACPLEMCAGKHAVDAIRDFAEKMGGRLFDGHHRPLSEKALAAVAATIDDAMAQRRKANQPARIYQADGTYKIAKELSFVTHQYTARGRFLDCNYFDVEAMDSMTGAIAGYECARELLAYRKAHKDTYLSISSTVEAAIHLFAEGDYSRVAKGNVARSFVLAMMEMISFSARHANFNTYIDDRIKATQSYADWEKERRATEAAAFVERMQAAKKARRQGGDAS